MTAYWWYILKVSSCIVLFYTFYSLVLRNCTFFMLNRLYLIFGILFSFIIPVLDFSFFEGQSPIVFSNIIHPVLMEADYDFYQSQILLNHVATINYSMILPVIYFSGITILFLKLLFSIVRIIKIRNNAETCLIGNRKILKMDSIVPFSFFNMIFLPKNESNPMIIEHEMAHIKQFHWFDLMITEIASMLLWFNPFIVFYKRSLKLQHEYLADSSVIKDDTQIVDYLGCMLKRIRVADHDGLISQFYCKTIKKRIVMMTKNKTSVKYLGVYLLVLPLISFMLFALASCKTTLNNDDKIAVNDIAFQPSIYPLDSKKVTHIVEYGDRINPVTRKNDFHYGIDFAVPEGEQIISTAYGIVVEAEFHSLKGNYITIKHRDKFSTSYFHLKSISVKVGDKIEKGQVIGYAGNTGKSSIGTHLHYEVIKNGERINPKDYLPK